LIHLNARIAPLWQCECKSQEMPVTASNLFVIIIGILVFGAFASLLAWAQLYARPATARVVRPTRRPPF
jgi:hypothetical protein